MKPINIISAYQTVQAFEDTTNIRNNLKSQEARGLCELIKILKEKDMDFSGYNGYYISYSINQISKQFDLLRFSDDSVINIELKSTLDFDKIAKQMNENNYYLQFLNKTITIFTYVENDGLYQFCENKPQKTDISVLISCLESQMVNYDINPDMLFVASNYLVSPYNNTKSFLKGNYFLTDHQKNIKKDILNHFNQETYFISFISANAGTGKTLLTYDIAKELINLNTSPVIIHTAALNSGQGYLINRGWKILPIKSIQEKTISKYLHQNVPLIIVDEAQRIRSTQLNMIIKQADNLSIPILFSYDPKQYLSKGEDKDIYEYCKENYPEILKRAYTVTHTLTNKIRTNKNIASFIQNMFIKNSSNSYTNYNDITIEYFEDIKDVRKYMAALSENKEWEPITYTVSQYNRELIEQISQISHNTAHSVIGQEFKKVALVMDNNFKYDDKGRLSVSQTYYDLGGMLYQIITRAVDELKIVVLKNKNLYSDLLSIKYKE
ncbi:MAG: ATP-binding protein [Defluviitaleaceae bacterium]|nr:ATP-binding protein [Defluviitaleaceae bacterium]